MSDESMDTTTKTRGRYHNPKSKFESTTDAELYSESEQYQRSVPEVWDTNTTCNCPPPVPQPTVYIRVVFLKVGEIDTLKEQYSAEIFLQAKWREPSLDNLSDGRRGDIDWEEKWNPKLLVQNCASDQTQKVWFDVQRSKGEAYVLEKRRLKGWFTENMELELFPFDIQHLSLNITSDLSSSDVTLVEDESEQSSVNRLSFIDEQEWEMRNFVEMLPRENKREYSNTKNNFPSILVRCCAFRRPGFFIWNILCVMGLISSLSFSTFAVDLNKPQNRLQLSFTLVLTGVAFKFVASQSLPKVPYLTYLDRYVLISMCIMYLVCVWHAVVTRVHDPELATTLDLWAWIVLVILFLLFQFIFIITVKINSTARRRGVFEAETVYKEKVTRLLKLERTTGWKHRQGKTTEFGLGTI